MIYPQDQRIHDQRNHDRIDQFRHNDPAQIIRELKITFQKEHQKIDHDPIQKLTQCDQEQRKFDILIKEKLLKQAIQCSHQQIDQASKSNDISTLNIQ